MSETIRDRLKDVICRHLVEEQGFGMDDAYETACELADEIFLEFEVEPVEQDLKGAWLVTGEPDEE
ncbi:MAG: hypothetical protein KKF27_21485 [Gammaproteobacteria bacterium]|nr:hypothetical protein [Gammaproteobacteria bacterium]